MHDRLTTLPNRELFLDRLDACLIQARTDPYMRPTVMCIDIDRFKQINEGIGLSGGDSILLGVARRLIHLLKEQDTLARIAGDQFSVILLSEPNPEQVIDLADQIRRALSTPVKLGDREVALTASIGLALFDKELHPKRDDMLKDAEIAMRHAKRGGGNRIEVFRPAMRSQRSDRLALESDLRRALERGEIKVPVPARRPAGRPHSRRLRGAAALGPSASRPDSARPNSSPSRKKPGLSSSLASSRWSAPRANSPPGNRRST